MEEYSYIKLPPGFELKMQKVKEQMEVESRDRMQRLKPMLCDLIAYYRDDLGHSAGGSLHIVLDDGNLEDGHIWHCQQFAKEEGDSFGYFLATLMRYFTEDELQVLYDNDWKA